MKDYAGWRGAPLRDCPTTADAESWREETAESIKSRLVKIAAESAHSYQQHRIYLARFKDLREPLEERACDKRG